MDMNMLGYYLLFAAVVVLGVIGFEIRRVVNERRLKTQLVEEEALQAADMRDEQAAGTMNLGDPGKYVLTWHHISPEIKKGHVIRIQGQTGVDGPYEVVVDPKQDLSLRIVAYSHGQYDVRSDGEEPCLMNLHQGMHAVLKQDEDGSSHLVCGPSGNFKQDTFLQDQSALLVIENHIPKRQVGELRVYYKFAEPSVSFVGLAPAV
jgi:hypothetical protein